MSFRLKVTKTVLDMRHCSANIFIAAMCWFACAAHRCVRGRVGELRILLRKRRAAHELVLSAAGLKIDGIRLLLPCVLGEKPVFHPCVQARALLRGEVEKLDVRLRELSETREVVVRLLSAVDTNETLRL
ncbi:hypothetical protein [Paraburkholderia sp. ZP32-5]|uniref:hypothetical protein n=1 Tax=Paraburkholderia sp. ZP32-5 TaxID=2883245 RepID=UPI001F43400C|nr:hypothetical protein [Paraburkholderia sp. ZP32-5]